MFAKNLSVAGVLGAALLFTAMPEARADQWNKRTYLTVHEAIEVPGAILQPGRYVMKLVDSQSNRHIVQFLNDREDRVYSTVLAIPNYRMEPTGETQLSFYETPKGQPEALRAWFYPGDNFGQEFTYPKDRAILISQATNMNVPRSPSDWNAADHTVEQGDVVNESAMTPNNDTSTTDPNFRVSGPQVSDQDMVDDNAADVRGDDTAMNDDQEALAAQDDAQEPQPAPAPAPQTTPDPATRTDEPRMPQTAGNGALIGLLGMLMAGGALAAHRLRSK